jgi:Concanavalin A-like lectin/glucanases superfamily
LKDKIDTEVKIMKRIALAIIAAFVSYAPYASPLDNIVGNWHFDEGAGQYLWDSSGYGRNAYLGSSPSDPNAPTWITRRFDTTALHFNGKNTVQVTNSANLEPQKISVEAWVRSPISPGINRYIITKNPTTCSWAAYALYTGEGGLRFFIGNSSLYVESPTAGTTIWNGLWHHVAGTYDGISVRLYVDGFQVGSGTPTSNPIDYSSYSQKNLFIGDYSDGGATCRGGFVGDIDEVRIWNRALTAAEISFRATR